MCSRKQFGGHQREACTASCTATSVWLLADFHFSECDNNTILTLLVTFLHPIPFRETRIESMLTGIVGVTR